MSKRASAQWSVLPSCRDDRLADVVSLTDAEFNEYVSVATDVLKRNAHLIAAAPDLLAVTRMVLEWDGPGGTDSPMAAAARAAIAKAEGN